MLSLGKISFFFRYLIDSIVRAFIHTQKAFIAPVLVDKRFILYDGYGLDWTYRNAKAATLTFFNINQ
jgi:hypothetical protein